MARKAAGKVAQPSRLLRAGGTPALRPSVLLDTRVVYCGDNLEQLAKLPDACVDLIYIDPPFNSNRNYGQSLTGTVWGETKEKRACNSAFRTPHSAFALAGSFYYHCDWHASHYVKVMLDQIFGENNFFANNYLPL